MVGSSTGHGGSRGLLIEESRANSLPNPCHLVHSQVDAADEEETFSMRELVDAIDTHVETNDPEVTSNLHATEDGQGQLPPTDQPTWNALDDDVIQLTPDDASV